MVFAVLEIISALGFSELFEDTAAEFPEFVDGPFHAVSGQFLQLGKRDLDRIQIWRVEEKIAQLPALRFDGFADSSDLMAGKIVHYDDVAKF